MGNKMSKEKRRNWENCKQIELAVKRGKTGTNGGKRDQTSIPEWAK